MTRLFGNKKAGEVVTILLWHSNGVRENIRLRLRSDLTRSEDDNSPYSMSDFDMDQSTAYQLQNFSYSYTLKNGAHIYRGHAPQPSRLIKYAVRIMKAIKSRAASCKDCVSGDVACARHKK